MNIRDEFPRRVEVLDHQWITLSDGVRLQLPHLAAGRRRDRPRAGHPRGEPLPPHRRWAARLGDLPLLGGLRLRLRPRRPARHRRFRGPDRRRVQRAGAARRLRGDRLARRAALVHRQRGHDRHLLDRLQQPPGGGSASAGPQGGRHSHVDRRPLRRRRALQGRLRLGPRHAVLGRHDAALQRPAGPPPGRRRRGLARALARPARSQSTTGPRPGSPTSAATPTGSTARSARTTARSRRRSTRSAAGPTATTTPSCASWPACPGRARA